MLKTYKYRILPSQSQIHDLTIHFGHNRYIWNNTLNHIKNENNNQYTSKNNLSARLTLIKKQSSWLSDAHSQTLQATIKRLDQAYQRFFKKQSAYPKFKHKYSEQSIEFPQNTTIDFSLNSIKIPKIGYIKAILHRKFKGNIKTCTIKRSKSGEHYACFVVDDGMVKPKVKTDIKLTGIDLGIKDLVITSHGKKYTNNKFLKKKLQQLRKAQKELSRRSKKKYNMSVVKETFGPFTKLYKPFSSLTSVSIYSNRREKSRLKVAKLHRNVVNCRDDYLHKVSKQLVEENEGLAFENLNIRGMVRNKRLSQSIMDCGWGKLIGLCQYKAERIGKVCLKIGTFFASSKKCSVCGEKYRGLMLSEREWVCEHCGSKHDRDVNAAFNISVEGECLLIDMVSNGEFDNQEKPRKIYYGNKKKDSTVESNKKSAGLAERGEEVSRKSVSANLDEACQEMHPSDAEALPFTIGA